MSQPQTSLTSRDVAPRRPRVLPLHEIERGTVPKPAYLLVVEGLVDGDFERLAVGVGDLERCLLYTSPSPRDRTRSRMPSSA